MGLGLGVEELDLGSDRMVVEMGLGELEEVDLGHLGLGLEEVLLGEDHLVVVGEGVVGEIEDDVHDHDENVVFCSAFALLFRWCVEYDTLAVYHCPLSTARASLSTVNWHFHALFTCF